MKSFKSFLYLATAAALTWCCAACSDNWDNHFSENEDTKTFSNLSLWEQISANPELSNFAQLCQQTHIWIEDSIRAEGIDRPNPNARLNYTFKDLLSDTHLTVFAPKNAALSSEEWNRWLNESSYIVQTQFLGLYMRRNRINIPVTGHKAEENVYMLNGKSLVLNYADKSLNGAHISDCNIPAKNGVLHVLADQVEFRYNLMEYLRSLDKTNDFAHYFCMGDTLTFNDGSSIKGEDSPEGEFRYIDINHSYGNKYLHAYSEKDPAYSEFSFGGLNTSLSLEDSMHVMIIPSNAAYQAQMEKLKKFYVYADRYPDQSRRNAITIANHPDANASKLSLNTDVAVYKELLAEKMAFSSILRTVMYNIHTQQPTPGLNVSHDKLQNAVLDGFGDWIEAFASADPYSLNNVYGFRTMHGDTLRNMPYYPEYKLAWQPEGPKTDKIGTMWETNYRVLDAFDGKHKTPTARLSNGLAYVVDNYNFPLNIVNNLDNRISPSSYFQAALHSELADRDKPYLPSNITVEPDSMRKYGKVDGSSFWAINPQNTAAVDLKVMLNNNIIKGAYDIYMVCVPDHFYSHEFDKTGLNQRQARFKARMVYTDESGNEVNSPWSDKFSMPRRAKDDYLYNSPDTILLFENFTFPVAYAGLSNTCPLLELSIDQYSSTSKTVTNNLCIDFIYMKCKEN